MAVIYAWLLITFFGLLWGVFMLGRATCDNDWFEELRFSDDAKAHSAGGVESAAGGAFYVFLWLLAGVVSFLQKPVGPRPVTVASLLVALPLIIGVAVVIGVSVRQQWRRNQMKRRQLPSEIIEEARPGPLRVDLD